MRATVTSVLGMQQPDVSTYVALRGSTSPTGTRTLAYKEFELLGSSSGSTLRSPNVKVEYSPNIFTQEHGPLPIHHGLFTNSHFISALRTRQHFLHTHSGGLASEDDSSRKRLTERLTGS